MPELPLVDGMGGFARVLLPVTLDVGSVTFGLWLQVGTDAVMAPGPVWNDPAACMALTFEGGIAHRVPPWGDALWEARAMPRPTTPTRSRSSCAGTASSTRC